MSKDVTMCKCAVRPKETMGSIDHVLALQQILELQRGWLQCSCVNGNGKTSWGADDMPPEVRVPAAKPDHLS